MRIFYVTKPAHVFVWTALLVDDNPYSRAYQHTEEETPGRSANCPSKLNSSDLVTSTQAVYISVQKCLYYKSSRPQSLHFSPSKSKTTKKISLPLSLSIRASPSPSLRISPSLSPPPLSPSPLSLSSPLLLSSCLSLFLLSIQMQSIRESKRTQSLLEKMH